MAGTEGECVYRLAGQGVSCRVPGPVPCRDDAILDILPRCVARDPFQRHGVQALRMENGEKGLPEVVVLPLGEAALPEPGLVDRPDEATEPVDVHEAVGDDVGGPRAGNGQHDGGKLCTRRGVDATGKGRLQPHAKFVCADEGMVLLSIRGRVLFAVAARVPNNESGLGGELCGHDGTAVRENGLVT